jgi:dTDP-4-amino-4,6-dideoxygalactose transaminase
VVTAALEVPGDFDNFAEVLRKYLGVENVFFASSGRAALTILLKALGQGSGRREVIIPAYTCLSVPSSVVRAGLVARLCDVDPKTLDFDQNALRRLDLGRALCIVPSGLYGMPADVPALRSIAWSCGAFLIDDAAQCLGATIGGKPCGTMGDAGFYSLSRGKNITAMGGGVVITHKQEVAQLIERELGKLPNPSAVGVLSIALSSLLYAIMLPPSRYWLLDRIPFLGLGVSVFDPHFNMTRLSQYQGRLASRLLPLVHSYNHIRHENAYRLLRGIGGIEGIEIPQPANGANPAYLRFPILARDTTHRSRLLSRLKDAGIGASPSYPTAIGDIPGIEQYLARDQRPCPQAQSIATRIITLPTHPYVASNDVDRMIEIIREDS